MKQFSFQNTDFGSLGTVFHVVPFTIHYSSFKMIGSTVTANEPKL